MGGSWPIANNAIICAAHYYCAAKDLAGALVEPFTSSLPDGSPSGATVVDAESLKAAVAFSWWSPKVVAARLAQLAQLASALLRGEAGARGGGSGRLPAALDALLDAAARGVGKASADSGGIVIVFDHGPGGARIAGDRAGWALPAREALTRSRRRGGWWRPSQTRQSVLAAYLDDMCVTRRMGRLTNGPKTQDEEAFEGISAPRAIAAYLVASGVPRELVVRANSLTVAPRGGLIAEMRFQPENIACIASEKLSTEAA